MSGLIACDTPELARLSRLMDARETLGAIFAQTRRRLAAWHGEPALEPWAQGVLALVEVNAGTSALLGFGRASVELAGRLSPAALGETGLAAAALQLSRATLYRKLQRYGIST